MNTGGARGIAEELYRLERLSVGHATTPQMGSTSLEDGLEFRDEDGNVLARVGGNGGAFNFEYVEGPPPPTPSPPLVISETGFAQVTWDGQFADPETLWNDPLAEPTRDVDRIEVHFAREPDFVPDNVHTFAGVMPAYPEGGKLTVGPFTEGGLWHCRLVAKSKPGHPSDPSMSAPVAIVGVNLESELMRTWLDADDAMESADGKNSVHHGDEEPTPPPGGFKEGDLWFGPGNMPHRWDGERWVSAADERVEALEDAQAELRGELQDVRASASSARGVVHYSPTPPTPTAEGELWFDTSAEGNNAPHVWTGSEWLSLEDARVNGLMDEVAAALGVQQSGIDAELADLRREIDADISRVLTDAGADAQRRADQAQAAAEAAAKAYAEAIASGAEEADLEELREHMDLVAGQAREAAIEAAGVQARELIAASETTIMSAVDSKNRIIWSTSTPTSGSYNTGDMWFRHNGTGNVIAQWRWDGAWQQQRLDDAVIANLDAGKIVSGFIDAARIRAGSITADKVLVGGANLLPNPNFEDGGAGWALNSISITAGAGIGGSNTLTIAETSGKAGSYAGVREADRWATAKVTPGQAYLISAWVRSDTEIPVGDAALYARAYAETGDERAFASPSTRSNQDAIPAGEWVRVSGLVRVPDGYPRLALGLYRRAAGAAITWCLPSVTLATDSTSIVPGAISTGHIAAKAIEAGNIAAGAISTDHLAADAVTAAKIKAGTITADLMAAGTITADSGVIGSIDAGKITVGELDGARVKAGSVTADKLLVGGALNLIPGLEPGGNKGYTSMTWDGTEKALKYVGKSSLTSDETFKLPPGEYVVEADIKASVAGTRAHAGVAGQADTTAKYKYGISNVLVGTEWQHFSAPLVISEGEEGTFRFRLLHAYAGDGTATTWYRNLVLRPRVGATLIADGAITTEKIATGAITAESGVIGSLDAGKITTGELDGRRIRANTVATEQLAADAIDGMTITGATIQTSRANSGVKIDATGLRLMNNFGVQIASMTYQGFEALGSFRTGGDNERRVEIRNDLWTAGAGILFLQKEEVTSAALSPYQARIGAPARGHLEIAGSEIEGQYRNRLKLLSSGNVELLSAKMNGANPSGDHARLAMISDQNASDSGLHLEVKGNNDRTGLSVAMSYYAPVSTTWSGTPIPVPGSMSLESADRIVLQARTTGGNSGNVIVRHDPGRPTSSSTFPVGTRNWGVAFQNSDNSMWGQIGGLVDGWGANGFGVRSIGRTLSLVSQTNLGHALVNHLTGSQGANVHMQSDGTIWRSTSSRRTKLDEAPIESEIDDFDDRILSLVAKTWYDRAAVEAYSDRLSAEAEGEEFVGVEVSDPFARIPGMVAEDVLDAGLKAFVTFDEDGNVDGLMYDRLGVALIPVVARLRDRVAELEKAIA